MRPLCAKIFPRWCQCNWCKNSAYHASDGKSRPTKASCKASCTEKCLERMTRRIDSQIMTDCNSSFSALLPSLLDRERERVWARWSYVWMHDRIWHDLTCLKCFSNLHGSTTLDGKTFSSQLRHELLDQKYTEHSCLHSTGSPTKSEAYFDLFDNLF